MNINDSKSFSYLPANPGQLSKSHLGQAYYSKWRFQRVLEFIKVSYLSLGASKDFLVYLMFPEEGVLGLILHTYF